MNQIARHGVIASSRAAAAGGGGGSPEVSKYALAQPMGSVTPALDTTVSPPTFSLAQPFGSTGPSIDTT